MRFKNLHKHFGVFLLKCSFYLSGRDRYMKHLVRFYSKNNVSFREGLPRFIAYDVYLDCSDSVSIGENSTIASGVIVLTHDYALDYAFVALGIKRGEEMCQYLPVFIGRNVFIGQKCIILPGSTIEDNVIVGAGSIVKGRLLSGFVYAGNPAKVICTMQEYYSKNTKK